MTTQPAAYNEAPAAHDTTPHELNAQLADSRDVFARISAGRSRRTIHASRKFSKNAFADAKQNYIDAMRAVIDSQVQLEMVGNEPDLGRSQTIKNELATQEMQAVRRAVYNQRMVQSGKYRLDHSGNLVEVKKSKLAATINKFYDWWAEQGSAKLLSTATVKKGAAMTILGAAVAAPAAAVAGVVLSPVAGGAVGAYAASKVARAAMATHLHRKSKDAATIDRPLEPIWYEYDSQLADTIEHQTEYEVRSNRNRMVLSIGAAALSGLVSATGIERAMGDKVMPATSVHPAPIETHSLPLPNAAIPQGTTPVTMGTLSETPVRPQASVSRPTLDKPKPSNWSIKAKLGFSGDTVSNEALQHLRSENITPTQTKISRLTQAILRHNNIDEPNQLAIGYSFKMPTGKTLAKILARKP